MKIPPFSLRIGRPLLRTKLPGFDGLYYCYWYRDIQGCQGGPLDHYLNVGWKEGRDPSAGFSTDGYLLANADVRAVGWNPLLHFLETGLAEGRLGWQKDISAPAPRPRATPLEAPKLLRGPKAG